MQDEEEQPLDPVMERVRKKMIRLLVISIGIMMVGLFTVLFAIIYKVSDGSGSADTANGEVIEQVVELPDGGKVLSTSYQPERIILEVLQESGGRVFITINSQTGKVLSRIRVE